MRSTSTTSTRSCRTSQRTVSSNRPEAQTRGGIASSARKKSPAVSLPVSREIPDVHYGADEHFVCGNRGSSEWTISGTTVEGESIEVRGCDLWTFDEHGKIVRKDSFWKIREPT